MLRKRIYVYMYVRWRKDLHNILWALLDFSSSWDEHVAIDRPSGYKIRALFSHGAE